MAEVLAPPLAADLAPEVSVESVDAEASVQVSAPAGADKPGEQTQPEYVSRGIYFVRAPRPELAGNDKLTKLETELSACFTKLKAINNKFNVKKGEANELRKQLSVARSLRNGSSPEFDDKMSRLKQLRDMRKGYLDKIQEAKAGRNELECRTEEELDERIAEIEHAIQHEGLTLNDEKAKVKQIAKLKGQREKIRSFQGAQEGLAQLDAEAKKLKAVIDEVEGEVNILRGERNEAKDIIDELSKKLGAVTGVLDEYQAERADIEATKRELQESLNALRAENDESMFEYRANRKLGLTIRDLVAEGRLDEARAMAAEQVDTYMAKLTTDKAYRQEYLKLWKDQRKYLVSELLPNSGTVAGAPAAGGPGGKGGNFGPGGKPAAPLVPQGKAKAEALIAAAMQEANAAIAAKRMAEPQRQPEPEPEPSSEEAEEGAAESQPQPPARRIVPGASEELTAVRKPKAAKAVAKHVTELPDIPDYEYSLPEVSEKPQASALTAEQQKAKLREQQRKLAEEAEERKRRRQEQQTKRAAKAKEAAAEAAAAAQRAAKAATRAAELAEAASAAAATTTDNEGEDSAAEGAAPAAAGSSKRRGGGGSKGAAAKLAAQQAAAAVLPLKKVLKKPAKVLKWWEETTNQAIGGVLLLLFILVVLAFSSN